MGRFKPIDDDEWGVSSRMQGLAGTVSVVHVTAVREAGAEVLGIVSIFSYNMSKSAEKLSGANVENVSLSNLDELCEVAQEKKIIGPEEVRRVLAFRDNPSDESWIKN